MKRFPILPLKPVLFVVFLLAALLMTAPGLHAQEQYSFTATGLIGVAGSIDASPDPGYGNAAFSLGFSWVTQPRTRIGVRLGQADFSGEQMDNLLDGELTYATIAGEYRNRDRFYESGVYIGVGIYNLEGQTAVGPKDEDAFGLVVGITGDFPITKRFSLLIETAGHYVEFETTQMFLTGHAGIAYSF